MADSPYVTTVTQDNFQQVVIEGSRERAVLVDFWADWCAPCRALAPILDTLANEYGGKLIIAKVNTEEEQAVAAQFGIRSLPTVQLFKDGQPIDQFMGALPEAQIREFLDRHLPGESDQILARAQGFLSAGDLDGASKLVAQAKEEQPENTRVRLMEAGIAAASGNHQNAKAILDDLPLEMANDPEVTGLRGQLLFAGLLANSPPEADLASRVEGDPKDSDARYRLAAHLVARGGYEAALEQLLELMKQDRAYEDDAGRKGMVMIFSMLGNEGELVTRFRAKMMNTLY